ncbi:MAG: hypothetical protein QHH14_09580 [Clostridiales bacterium]|nr:hypothetical protein [Clostridiales bacterium]
MSYFKAVMKWFFALSVFAGIISNLSLGAPVQRVEQRLSAFDPSLYKAMEWRCIGPYRGGRVTAVAGIPDQPLVYYFGATGGGVWKTEDAGLSWRCVSDGFFRTGSVGAIAVSEWDPNVVYVGMGEAPIRGNVSHGDGMYKSTDGGKTWKHVGLEATSQISRVRIHPRNPDLVYVAALGHVYGSNEERGVFRSSDGGKTWQKILCRDNKTGAIDLILDPSNPRIIYAALWEAHRTPWSLSSGGPGSGIFKSTDGGETWVEISRRQGLPQGVLGKIGVCVSPAQPSRVWAIVEAEDGGVFRSDDGGETWQKFNDDRRLRQRAWYYSRIYADPVDPNTVYVLNTGFYRSVDGGRTYSTIRVPHGDNHDLWIDPDDPKRMINSNDGGANVSFDGGVSWTEQDNQPTAQFYHVAVDDRFPYWVYGAQQDNSTVRIASRTDGFGIDRPDWHPVGGGESGFVVPRPGNADIVYAGSYGGLITRWDARTGQERVITAWPDNPMGWGAAELKYRFQWTAPILVSRFNPNVLYHAAQVLFKTTNEGQSWEIISSDLTTNDKSKQQSSGGPITQDNTSVEYYCTIFALGESFHDPNILWVGTDDGLVHLTKNGGKTWENITPRELPPWSLISMIEPSSFDAGIAYLAVDRHELDDFKPYIYKTSDYGRTWKLIGSGLPRNTFVRVVREDPKRRGLLYAGTETGVFVSFNDGANWQSLQLNLPVVPIHDLVVKDDDLVAATHGRSFWILDDLTPLHQLDEKVAASKFHLFKPRDAYRLRGTRADIPGLGKNPASGSVIYYHLREKPKGELTLEFLDSEGNLIRKFSSEARPEAEPGDASIRMPGRGASQPPPKETGMNRFVWNMRYPDAERVPGAVLWGGLTAGPVAVPGIYEVKLTVDGESLSQTWEWKKDPRLEVSLEELEDQFNFLIQVRDKISQVNRAIIQLRRVRQKIESLAGEIKGLDKSGNIIEEGKKIIARLTEIEGILIQSRSKSNQDPLNYPIKLDNKLAALASVVASADGRPTDQSRELFKELAAAADAEVAKFNSVLETDIPALNAMLKEAGIPHIIAK